jgi:hypothetical protein
VQYIENLEKCKKDYPFEFWLSDYEKGIGKYSESNCLEIKSIFDNLINELKKIKPNSYDDVKLEEIKKAVLQLNKVRVNKPYLIETMEREEFCDLIDNIAKAAGLDVEKVSSGRDLTSQWRTW